MSVGIREPSPPTFGCSKLKILEQTSKSIYKTAIFRISHCNGWDVATRFWSDDRYSDGDLGMLIASALLRVPTIHSKRRFLVLWAVAASKFARTRNSAVQADGPGL